MNGKCWKYGNMGNMENTENGKRGNMENIENMENMENMETYSIWKYWNKTLRIMKMQRTKTIMQNTKIARKRSQTNINCFTIPKSQKPLKKQETQISKKRCKTRSTSIYVYMYMSNTHVYTCVYTMYEHRVKNRLKSCEKHVKII